MTRLRSKAANTVHELSRALSHRRPLVTAFAYETTDWKMPTWLEVKMDAEIGSYQADDGGRLS